MSDPRVNPVKDANPRQPARYALRCFGLNGRPWRERPVFGTIPFMGIDGMCLREIRRPEQTGKDPFPIA